MAGATVLEIIYGLRIASNEDVNLRLAEAAMRVSVCAGTTVWAVDFFPFCELTGVG